MRHELTVVVPTRDDATSLYELAAQVNAVAIEAGISSELLVVNEGQSSATQATMQRLAIDFPLIHPCLIQSRRAGNGFGSLLRLGIAYATGRYVVVVSADLSDPLLLIPEMVTELRRGAQLVICSRYADSEARRVNNVPLSFRAYQRIYRAMIRILLGTWLSDSTNGFRAFDRRFATALGLSSNRFSICPELTFKTVLANGRVALVAGQPMSKGPGEGTEKFKLPLELPGYGLVLFRAWFHKLGWKWF